jgi:hypothetical protein
MALTAEFILQGYAYALEQCGVLLRDACRLYKEGSHAGAIVLTRSAQEALGQAHILLDMWRQASAGETFTTEQLREACKDQGSKQRGLYVDPTSETTWNRPTVTVSASDAFEALRVARNEYSIRIDEWYFAPGSSSNEVLEQSDPDLFTALDQWRERPKLLPAPDVGSAPTKTAAA